MRRRLIVLTGAALLSVAAFGATWHVDVDNVSGIEDGLSWATAYTLVQAALIYANYDDEVWVAQGAYVESITLPSRISVYGGFNGTETGLAQRDFVANPTVIDGNGASNVVVMNGTTNVRIDGFTITGGAAPWGPTGGGGIQCIGADGTNAISNCTITGNSAGAAGGGIACMGGSSPSITNCTITGNSAGPIAGGGGVLCWQSSPQIVNCIISGNSYGGILCVQQASPSIVNCTITGNSGSGLEARPVGPYPGDCDPVATNTIFADNTGYGIFEGDANSDPAVTHCLFYANGMGDYLDKDTGTPYSGAGNIDANIPEADNSTDGDPLLFRPAFGDYRLRIGSPGIDAGTSSGAPATDILAVARPQNSVVDIGAHEYPVEDDADGDGLADSIEGAGDADGDAIPNYLDLDSDQDGFPDASEEIIDFDRDGLPNYLDVDSDGDGIPDGVEGAGDPDGDGLPNYLDADSDDDGIPDALEGAGDPDSDGAPNFLDGDSDGDDISDTLEGTGDPDSDGVPNFLDGDSDGDGYMDAQEWVAGSDPYDSGSNPSYMPYRLGPATELLDAAFYAGEPGDGSNVAGRMATFPCAANNGRTVAFLAWNGATSSVAVFLVDLGNPGSWRRLTQDFWTDFPAATISWSPDDTFIFAGALRFSAATGAWVDQRFLYGRRVQNSSFTRLPANNWLLGEVGRDIIAIPVLTDGSPDSTREPAVVTDLGGIGMSLDWPAVARAGTAVTFADFHSSVDGVQADTGDVYVLDNLQAIAAAAQIYPTDISVLAPTSPGDPNLIAIRVGETENFAHTPQFSEDMTRVFFTEDRNNVFRADDFFGTMALADFDIMVSHADGSGVDFRLHKSGNQFGATPTPGGTRILYTSDVNGVFHIYASTLEVTTSLPGIPIGDPADNDLVTTLDTLASDSSGTTVMIPSGTTVDFPPDTPQEIQITTPIDPVTEPQLPPGVAAIPVIREFGPKGTQFSPPIVVTITYTDAEIGGADESTLKVFQYNEVTGIYDIEVTTIVERDLFKNTISFTVDHFSIYGIAETVDTTPPAISLSVRPNVLWPANHKMVEIYPTITVWDDYDPNPVVALKTITANEGNNWLGDANTSVDIRAGADGRIFLRAERSGRGVGRTYTITYQATDAAGNRSEASATVVVPHNR